MNKPIVLVDQQEINIQDNGGVGNYVSSLSRHLFMNQDSDMRFKFLKPQVTTNNMNQVDLLKRRVKKYTPQFFHPAIGSVYRMVRSKKTIEVSNSISEPEGNPALVHELSNYIFPNHLLRKPYSEIPLIVTFIDLQDFYFPDYFSNFELKERKSNYLLYKDSATHFIAISNHTKKSMIERLGIPAEKISVVYLGCHKILSPIDPLFEKVISELGSYFIYPAKFWAHKNHDFLMQALGRIGDTLKEKKIKLVLTGGFNAIDLKYLKEIACRYNIEKLVIPLGFLPEEKLHALISRAKCLVFPSLFEGFGMPLIEAMQLGCPVISSHAGSLPEIGSDAAIYFDPNSIESLITVIQSALHNNFQFNDLIQRGYENVKRFSWNQNANETLDVYKRVLNQSGVY